MSINGGILVVSYSEIQKKNKAMLKYFNKYNDEFTSSDEATNLSTLFSEFDFFKFDFRNENADAFCRAFQKYYNNKDTPFTIGDNIIFSSGDRLNDEYAKMLDIFISSSISYESYETW